MKLSRRQSLRLATDAAALPAVSSIATAQTYPTRPITMIVVKADAAKYWPMIKEFGIKGQ
jgi:hypothetical protein